MLLASYSSECLFTRGTKNGGLRDHITGGENITSKEPGVNASVEAYKYCRIHVATYCIHASLITLEEIIVHCSLCV